MVQVLSRFNGQGNEDVYEDFGVNVGTAAKAMNCEGFERITRINKAGCEEAE